MGISKNAKQMPCIPHRFRASSTSFFGNCGAKFRRKLKNLSETTADDKKWACRNRNVALADPNRMKAITQETGPFLERASSPEGLSCGQDARTTNSQDGCVSYYSAFFGADCHFPDQCCSSLGPLAIVMGRTRLTLGIDD